MGTETERKFLTIGEDWKALAEPVPYRQGYLCADAERTVRVRTVGERGFLTVKGRSVGLTRAEYEYEIPLQDARRMLETLCMRPLIEKTRRTIEYAGFIWEVDEFSGENHGLVVAEIELESEEQSFQRPPWVGREVSDDPRYFNAALAVHPYSLWEDDDSA